jgi:hypothetical protein
LGFEIEEKVHRPQSIRETEGAGSAKRIDFFMSLSEALLEPDPKVQKVEKKITAVPSLCFVCGFSLFQSAFSGHGLYLSLFKMLEKSDKIIFFQ